VAIRQFGLAAILEFVDKGASAAMGKVGRTAAALKSSFKGISDGMGTMSRGLGNIAMVSVPVGGAFAYMMKSGVMFEQSMANLKAVALDMSKTDEVALSGLAKTLGAQTKYTASEAADAMTELSRAGFSVKDIMSAVPGVLNAAAAEGISLSTAAEMVAANTRAFALAGKDATMIAGTLALASARTNASMVSLQEGLKFAAPAARELGYDFKATVGALGALHDIGIKGTLSGTALRMSLQKLVNPTKQSRAAMAQLGITSQSIFKDEKGGMRALPDVFLNLADKLRKIPDPVKRASIASKIFGIQAKSLGSAFNLTGEDMARFRKTQAELAVETGQSAKKMADLRLQSFTGQLELVTSAMEGVSIEMFGMLSGFTKGGMSKAADALSNLALALRVVRGEKITDPEALKQLKTLPPVFLEVARGIRAGFESAKATIASVLSSLGGVGRWLGFTGKEGAEGTARLATKFGLLLVAIGPVSAVLFGVTKLLGGMVQMAWGAGKAMVGAFSLASKAVGGLFGALASKVPWLGKLAGGAGGLLGKVGKFAETLTAQPVRVVNFGEMGGAGLKPGFGTGPGAGGTGLGEQAAGWRATLNGVISKIPLIGSTLSSSLGSIAGSAMPLAAKLGIFGAAVGAAGTAGYALGSWLDKKFGISDKLSTGLYNLFNQAEIQASKLRVANFGVSVTEKNAAQMAETLAGFAGQGMKTVGTEGGGRTELTKEFATGRVTAFLTQQMAQGTINAQQMTSILTRLDATLNRIPGAAAPAGVTPVAPKKAGDAMVTSGGILGVSAGDVVLNRAVLAAAVTSGMGGGMAGQVGAGALGGGDPGRTSPPAGGGGGGGTVRIEVPVSIDGKKIALAVAEVQLDQMERSGVTLKPGERTSLLQRGFAFGGAY
jgi:TP901 family phage tail tape measure protein